MSTHISSDKSSEKKNENLSVKQIMSKQTNTNSMLDTSDSFCDMNSSNKSKNKHKNSINCLLNCTRYYLNLSIIGSMPTPTFHLECQETPLFFNKISSQQIIKRIRAKDDGEIFTEKTTKVFSEEMGHLNEETLEKNDLLLGHGLKFPIDNSKDEKDSFNISTKEITQANINLSNTSSILIEIDLKEMNHNKKNYNIVDKLFINNEIYCNLNAKVHNISLLKCDIIFQLSPKAIVKTISLRMGEYKKLYKSSRTKGKFIYKRRFFAPLIDFPNVGITFSSDPKIDINKDLNILSTNFNQITNRNFIIEKIYFCFDIPNFLLYKPIDPNDDSLSSFSGKSLSHNNDTNFPQINNKPDKIIYNNNNDNPRNNTNKFDQLFQANINSNPKEDNYIEYNKFFSPQRFIGNNRINEYNPKISLDSGFYNNFENLENFDGYKENREIIQYNNYKNDLKPERDERNGIIKYYESSQYMNNNYNGYNSVNINYNNYNINSNNYYINNYNNYSSQLVESKVENYQQQYYPEYYYRAFDMDMNINLKSFSNVNIYSLPFYNYNNEVSTYTSSLIQFSDEFAMTLFELYKDKSKCICNFNIFKNLIFIKAKNGVSFSDKKNIKLTSYLKAFNKVSIFGLEVPYITLKGRKKCFLFNPTLSSILLTITKKNIVEKLFNFISCINSRNSISGESELIHMTFDNDSFEIDNIKITVISQDNLKIEYSETAPSYYRETLDKKLKKIRKIINKLNILTSDIINDESYLCICWTPSNTYQIETSFFAYYSFDLQLLGILGKKLDDNIWFKSFSNNPCNYKDYKQDYEQSALFVEQILNKINYKNDFSNFYVCENSQY